MTDWDKKRQVMHRYDVTSRLYDMRYAEEQKPKIEAAIKNSGVGEDSSVLDLGCGTGLLTQKVAEKAEVTVALDLSKQSLLKAKKRLSETSHTHLVLGDADHLPLNSGVFSHLYAITVLQNMPTPLKTLQEAKRVVKENGWIVVTGLKKKFPPESFLGLLRKAGLNPTGLKGDQLNCQVAICTG